MAEFFKWDANVFGLKVKEMDDEHQELIRLMNKLFDSNQNNQPFNEIKKHVDALAEYTVKHFADEEKYMEKISFPGLQTHKIIHQQLLEQFKGYVTDFTKTQKITDAFFKFLAVWLTSHIKGIDMKYAEHALKKAS